MAGGKDREENTKHISAKQPLLLSKILESWGEGRRWGINESEGTGYEKGMWLSVCQAGQWIVFSGELRRTLIQQDPWDGCDLSEVGSVLVGSSEQVRTESASVTKSRQNDKATGSPWATRKHTWQDWCWAGVPREKWAESKGCACELLVVRRSQPQSIRAAEGAGDSYCVCYLLEMVRSGSFLKNMTMWSKVFRKTHAFAFSEGCVAVRNHNTRPHSA